MCDPGWDSRNNKEPTRLFVKDIIALVPEAGYTALQSSFIQKRGNER
jgi:hypothetical protein